METKYLHKLFQKLYSTLENSAATEGNTKQTNRREGPIIKSYTHTEISVPVWDQQTMIVKFKLQYWCHRWPQFALHISYINAHNIGVSVQEEPEKHGPWQRTGRQVSTQGSSAEQPFLLTLARAPCAPQMLWRRAKSRAFLFPFSETSPLVLRATEWMSGASIPLVSPSPSPQEEQYRVCDLN